MVAAQNGITTHITLNNYCPMRLRHSPVSVPVTVGDPVATATAAIPILAQITVLADSRPVVIGMTACTIRLVGR